ncbi:MAG TPA: AAA family ATPase [Terracidiphilus sp.]
MTQSAQSAPSSDLLYILSGGPGSGKSTLIEALSAHGVASMPEAGRAVIRDQVATGGNALPWADRSAFADLMFAHDLRSYDQALALGAPVLFDRGLPDVAGYLRLCELPVPEPMLRQIHFRRYNRSVFIAPPWHEIFTQDAERKQSFAEAEATCEVMRQTYLELDYELVTLPLAPVEARVQFVLSQMGF